jgi:hypothetical protein
MLTRDNIDQLLSTLKNTWEVRRSPSKRGQARRMLALLLSAPAQTEIYAQTMRDPDTREEQFWYKVYFFTPAGVLKSDTTGDFLTTRQEARRVTRAQGLKRVPFEVLMRNWQAHGLWEKSRPISERLLRDWCTAHGLPPRLRPQWTFGPRSPHEENGV